MKKLTTFDNKTLNCGTVLTPVKVDLNIYEGEKQDINFGFLNVEGELVRIGGRKLTVKNNLIERFIIQNQLIDEAIDFWSK